jgi:nickel-dependent lactate racemase
MLTRSSLVFTGRHPSPLASGEERSIAQCGAAQFPGQERSVATGARCRDERLHQFRVSACVGCAGAPIFWLTMESNGTPRAAGSLAEAETAAICGRFLGERDLDGKRVLMLIPDRSRTCPLAQVFPLLYEQLSPRVASLDVLVALGTHPPLSDEQICGLVGTTPAERKKMYPLASFHNHLWRDPDALAEIGRLSRDEVGLLTNGLFEMEVPVTCNRMAMDHDVIMIVGPVFPHEVVGFSGGNKYIMPGIAGQEIIDFFHWLGAVITNPEIIGNKWTPVRKVVDKAAGMLRATRIAVCMVVKDGGLAGLFCGTPEEAWSAAADLSAQVHIEYKGRRYHTVLSCAPPMYDDLWTGGKCMYKVEPVVADGGRVIIFAPHITEISPVHGAVLREIGYHTRDFFLSQWDKYRKYPWGVLAHSTHVKGIGTCEGGVEKPRVDVVLSTGIPEEVCRSVNLGYMDPTGVELADFEGRESEGMLCVPRAGEILYRPERRR